MTLTPLLVAKIALGLVLLGAIALAARGRAPRRPAPAEDLRRLVSGALLLYAVGIAALLSGQATLSTITFACGVGAAALAAWLSRGTGGDDPPDGGEEPPARVPPPAPAGAGWDWDRFDRERREWEDRRPAAPR